MLSRPVKYCKVNGSWNRAQFKCLACTVRNLYASEKNYELDEKQGSALRYDMESTHKIIAQGHASDSDAELELLIAKYTLEYLYQWTNHFDPVQLAQIKQILDTGEETQTLLKAIMGDSSLPS